MIIIYIVFSYLILSLSASNIPKDYSGFYQRSRHHALVRRANEAFKVPGKVLTGYWQNFYNGATPLKLSQIPSAYNVIAVAFADSVSNQPGKLTFQLDSGLVSRIPGGYTMNQFKADISLLRSQNRFVILSVGGELGQVDTSSRTAANNFASSLFQLMKDIGFAGVDIDLENGFNPGYLADALKQLNVLSPGYILTMAPQTLDVQAPRGSASSSYMRLITSVSSLITVVNTQYYNSGRVYYQGTVDFMTALADILIAGRYLKPSQVGLGLPASSRGAGSGYTNPNYLNAALECLATGNKCGAYRPVGKYPDIRGAMTWSINWDALNGFQFARIVGPKLSTMPGSSPPPTTTTTRTTTTTLAPTPTPSLLPTFTLPGKVLTGYWQNFINPATPLRLRDIPIEYNLIIVAFATANPSQSGKMEFQLDPYLSQRITATTGQSYTNQNLKNDISLLNSQGRLVLFSVGGEQSRVIVNSVSAANTFANSAFAIMKEYGFAGIDIDIETGINPNFMAQALRNLAKLYPGYILTMAPQTLDVQKTNSYLQLCQLIPDLISIVHTQYYNSGSMYGQDGRVYYQGTVDFMTALADILLTGPLKPQQVALGLPASANAAGSGYMNPNYLNAALECLATGNKCGAYQPVGKYPDIRGAMTWSINWDASNGFQFARILYPKLKSMKGGSQYTAIRSAGTITSSVSSMNPATSLSAGTLTTISSMNSATTTTTQTLPTNPSTNTDCQVGQLRCNATQTNVFETCVSNNQWVTRSCPNGLVCQSTENNSIICNYAV